MGKRFQNARFSVTPVSVTSTRVLRLSGQGDTHVIAYRKRPMPRTAERTCRTYPIPPVHPLALTGHQQRLCLTLLLAAFVFCLLLLPQTVRGANWYQFHTIADYHSLPNFPNPNKPESLYAPAMNSSGQVVFMASSGEGDAVIYRGGVGSLETIVRNNKHDPQSPFLHLEGHCSINDWGDVAFSGTTNSGTGSAVVKFSQSSQVLITIAEGSYNGNGTSPDIRLVRHPSINNAGQVAFKLEDMQSYKHAVVGSGGGLTFLHNLDDTSDPFNPLIRVQSPALDVVQYVAPGLGLAGLWKDNGINVTSIATSPSALYEDIKGGISISNPGAVSYIANPAGAVDEAVYLSWGGSGPYSQDPHPMKVADTDGSFGSFDQTAASLGGVVFRAQLDLTEAPGIYLAQETFPTLWNTEKILAEGDTISGYQSSASNVHISPTAFNDQGQIAIRVSLGDPFEEATQALIIRADPFTLQSVYEASMAIAAIKTDGDASMSQRVEFSPGNESFAFDFAFPAETGNLVVSLGGQVLVELDALDGVADGLTRFEAEVDLAALFPDGTAEALLEFQLYSNDATAGLYLDNIDFASLENGNFASGDLSAWQSSFASGDGVGVAVNPYGPSPAVPEPAALLLALLGLALLPRRRRR